MKTLQGNSGQTNIEDTGSASGFPVSRTKQPRCRLYACLIALACSGVAMHVEAQTSIQYLRANRVWELSSGEMTYALGSNEKGELQTIYWGPRLSTNTVVPPPTSNPELASFDPPAATTPLEYAGWSTGLPTQPALKVSAPNGDRAVSLQIASQQPPLVPGADTLEIVLFDRVAELYVHLFYKLLPQGMLARWSKVENRGRTTLTVEQAASATLNLPPRDNYELSWLSGRWGGEWQLHTAPIQPGHTVLESRRGSTSHQANPWLAVGEKDRTTETSGPVWFAELGWSGSWQIDVEQTPTRRVKITAGYNAFDFAYVLPPGASLQTPMFYAGFTGQGQGGASRILHRVQQESILPHAAARKARPIIYNSWEATNFAVTEAGQLALAEKAASLGIERMVIDDGWFGQRKNDHAGLGDWYVNAEKFPHGLKPVIDRVHELGMDFGLWVEPEMVNPDSDLYRKHPDWVLNFPNRPQTEARNQLVLNLAREDVKQYILGFLEKLLAENDIAFLKWDYNRNWSEPGWTAVPLAQQKEVYVRYVDNLYAILAELRRKHPKLEIESCSGGGGRVDLGVLRYTDEVWPSDNTDAFDRLNIQDGFSHAYTPGIMVAWVTDVPNFLDRRSIPLRFRFDVAMTGALGVGSDITKWSADESVLAKERIAFYKTVRSTVQFGSLHRLVSPLHSEQSAVQYVAGDGHQSVLFAFLHSQQLGEDFQTLYLQGLEDNATYRVRALDPAKAPGLSGTMTGSALMHLGLRLTLAGDYDSTAIVLERTDGNTESASNSPGDRH